MPPRQGSVAYHLPRHFSGFSLEHLIVVFANLIKMIKVRASLKSRYVYFNDFTAGEFQRNFHSPWAANCYRNSQLTVNENHLILENMKM